MKKNVGTIDKLTRIFIAFAILGLFFSNLISGTVALVLIILAGTLILTSFFSYCPLYSIFGIGTGKKGA